MLEERSEPRRIVSSAISKLSELKHFQEEVELESKKSRKDVVGFGLIRASVLRLMVESVIAELR